MVFAGESASLSVIKIISLQILSFCTLLNRRRLMACLHLIRSVSLCEPERSTSHLREVSLTDPRLERRGLDPAG